MGKHVNHGINKYLTHIVMLTLIMGLMEIITIVEIQMPIKKLFGVTLLILILLGNCVNQGVLQLLMILMILPNQSRKREETGKEIQTSLLEELIWKLLE